MKPAPFDYVAAQSVEQAVALLASRDDATIIAGGQSLMPVLNMRLGRPELVIDIGEISGLAHIEVDESGSLHIGASSTQTRALSDTRVASGWPLLTAALSQIGHPQIRNRGPVGGSLAHNDPAAELPAAAVALGARMTVTSPDGDRVVGADDFFRGPFMTALGAVDLLVSVTVPPLPAGAGWSFREFALRPGDFATVGVAAVLTRRDDIVDTARLVAFGAGGSPLRVAAAEGALIGSTPSAAGDRLANAVASALDPPDDVHASAEFRRELAQQLVGEAVEEAWGRTR